MATERDAVADELLDRRVHRADVQGPMDVARHPCPFGDLQTQVPGHQRRGPGDGDVVELVLAFAPDLQGVAKALGGDQTSDRARALDQGVGEQRGGVDHAADAARVDPILVQEAGDAGHDPVRRVVVGRQYLAVQLSAGVVVVDHDVGERAADINAQG